MGINGWSDQYETTQKVNLLANPVDTSLTSRTDHAAVPAVVCIGQDVDLAAVGQDAVAVAETGVAIDAAGAGDAGGCRIRPVRADDAAPAAIGYAGRQVCFAAIGGDAVTVPEAPVAARDYAHTVHACFDGVRQVADQAAIAAIGDTCIRIGLAAVRRIAVTVGKARVTGDDHAGAGITGACGIGKKASTPAIAAMADVGSKVSLASVCRIAVTIAITSDALESANTLLARGHGIGRRRTRGVASIAMCGVPEQEDFATVSGIQIAIRETGIAEPDRANAVHAGGRGVREAADVSAGTAIVRTRIGIRFASVRGVAVAVDQAGVAISRKKAVDEQRNVRAVDHAVAVHVAMWDCRVSSRGRAQEGQCCHRDWRKRVDQTDSSRHNSRPRC